MRHALPLFIALSLVPLAGCADILDAYLGGGDPENEPGDDAGSEAPEENVNAITGTLSFTIYDEADSDAVLCAVDRVMTSDDPDFGFLALTSKQGEGSRLLLTMGDRETEPEVYGFSIEYGAGDEITDPPGNTPFTTVQGQLSKWVLLQGCYGLVGEDLFVSLSDGDGGDMDSFALTLQGWEGEAAYSVSGFECPLDLDANDCRIAEGRVNLTHTVVGHHYADANLRSELSMDIDVHTIWGSAP
jgi:hypothetical protein